MVSSDDLGKINMLYTERNSIAGFLGLMDDPSFHILDMTGGKQSAGESRFWQHTQRVNTEQMSYPPAMLDAIKGFLTERQSAIAAELESLGLTFSEPPPPEPEPAAAEQPKPKAPAHGRAPSQSRRK